MFDANKLKSYFSTTVNRVKMVGIPIINTFLHFVRELLKVVRITIIQLESTYFFVVDKFRKTYFSVAFLIEL